MIEGIKYIYSERHNQKQNMISVTQKSWGLCIFCHWFIIESIIDKILKDLLTIQLQWIWKNVMNIPTKTPSPSALKKSLFQITN